MESYEYRTLFEFESFYWWYRGLHAILLDTLHSLGLGIDSLVLDAGCGTGQNLANIASQVTPRAFGLDISDHACPFWLQRGLKQVCLASVNQIPFSNDSFDAVLSIDVLELEAVKEELAYAELWRVTKVGGYILIVVPAYEQLMSEEHHRAVRAVRRYTRRRVLNLVNKSPVQIVRLTHLFGVLLPAVAAYRLLLRYCAHKRDSPPRSELRRLPPILNSLLFRVVDLERRLLRKISLPFGSSILVVARKINK